MTDVRLHGLEQAIRAMKDAEPRLQKNALRAATGGMAAETRNMARSLVPQDTGNLRKNIVSRRGGRGRGRHRVSALVSVRQEKEIGGARWVQANFNTGAKDLARDYANNAFYWFFVEWGTVHMPARPYLRPAFDWLKATFDWKFARLVREKFDRALQRNLG